MIRINCTTDATRKLTELVQFQGALKKRSDKDIDALAASIKEDGLVTPFIIWKSDDGEKLLDGHGRHSAVIKLAMTDPEVLTQDLPVVVVEAANENEAKKQLLLINSQYGKMTKMGVASFTAGTDIDLSKYRVPALKVTSIPKMAKVLSPFSDSEIIRIRVSRDIAPKIREMLAQAQGVEVL
jgi:hypothetical protein